MTLRTRFFLLVWPLVVGAMVLLAALVGRWGVSEINRVSVRTETRNDGRVVESVRLDSVYTRVAASVRVPPEARAEAFRRQVLIALGVGSVLAAVATLLLSRPLVGRVGELAEAVRALRRGDLAARAPVRGRDELAELARAFNGMTEELAASERRRRQLLSDVSHELRTPLTNVLGSLEAMQDGLRPPDQAGLAMVHDEAMLLVRLVDDLRDVTLADAGELTLRPEPLDAAMEASRAAAAFPPVAGRAPIRVTPAPAPIPLTADPARLAQMLRNLLDNARAHAPADSVITLTVEPAGGGARFLVRNTGAPIPPEHLGRLWERFYRVDGSRTRATGGMGLGLAVVKRLATAHGGTVDVRSDATDGTVFTITLP